MEARITVLTKWAAWARGFESTSATKFMPDDTWKTTFEIKLRREHRDDAHGRTVLSLYDIINIHSGQVVGTYKDERYAKKQAKRKYKKLIRLIEKLFTSRI